MIRTCNDCMFYIDGHCWVDLEAREPCDAACSHFKEKALEEIEGEKA